MLMLILTHSGFIRKLIFLHLAHPDPQFFFEDLPDNAAASSVRSWAHNLPGLHQDLQQDIPGSEAGPSSGDLQVSDLDDAATPDLGSLLAHFQALTIWQGARIQQLEEALAERENLLLTVGLLPAAAPPDQGLLGILAAEEEGREPEEEQEEEGADGEAAREEQQPVLLGPPLGFTRCRLGYCHNADECFVPSEGTFKVRGQDCAPFAESPKFVCTGNEQAYANACLSLNMPLQVSMDLLVTDLTDGSEFFAGLTDESVASSLFSCPDIVQSYCTNPVRTVALVQAAADIKGEFLFSDSFQVIGFRSPELPTVEQEQAEEGLGERQQRLSYRELLEAP